MPTHLSPAMPGGPAMAPGGTPDADDRLAPLAASLAGRLRAVCQDWDAAEFDTLMRRIARTKLRWSDQGYGA